MKKVYTIFITVLLTAICFAQVPQKMSYQAVIRNSTDQLITNHAVGMRISILQGSATGTPVYIETQTSTSNANGLVTIEIGGGIPITGTFASIDWSPGIYFIKTETDPIGGTSYNITGTSQILSVPYALYAKTAGSHYIGESYGGGIVFYVYDNGQHGLIAATADQSRGVVWTNTAFQYTFFNAQRSGINGGLLNTERIIIQSGAGSYAAQLCATYRGGDFADWYLPSIHELYLLCLQKNVVGGFSENIYWSSTEENDIYAYYLSFHWDSGEYTNKSGTHYVRAIRAF